LAGRYDNPLPPWFLAPITSLKIPAQAKTDVEKAENKEIYKCRHLFGGILF